MVINKFMFIKYQWHNPWLVVPVWFNVEDPLPADWIGQIPGIDYKIGNIKKNSYYKDWKVQLKVFNHEKSETNKNVIGIILLVIKKAGLFGCWGIPKFWTGYPQFLISNTNTNNIRIGLGPGPSPGPLLVPRPWFWARAGAQSNWYIIGICIGVLLELVYYWYWYWHNLTLDRPK